ncbi:MAG: hypothetical protein ACXABY_31955 [Candidatus Thorarchaeota archaeon]|jgi:hypothetical protein
MILEKGNMWSAFRESDLWLFTGNSFVTKRGLLVMGRGLALEVKKEFPNSGEEFGWLIKEIGKHLKSYGIMRSDNVPGIGVFQVKYHFKAKASLSLIGYSCVRLMEILDGTGFSNVHLNFPGIGFGRLPREQVLPIISELPDTVHIWERR